MAGVAPGASSLVSILHLVRHGQASFGQDNYDRLSDLGFKQARITGRHLRDLGLKLDAAYCGRLSRQVDTARAALACLDSSPPLRELPEFDEYDSGPIIKALLPVMRQEVPELDAVTQDMFRDRKSFQLIYEAAMLRWISGRHDALVPESWSAFLGRVARGLERVRDENGRGRAVAIFTSGGPIAAVLRLALDLADERALRLTWVIKNASLSSFFYDDQRLTLSLFNSTAHLELAGEPGLVTYR